MFLLVVCYGSAIDVAFLWSLTRIDTPVLSLPAYFNDLEENRENNVAGQNQLRINEFRDCLPFPDLSQSSSLQPCREKNCLVEQRKNPIQPISENQTARGNIHRHPQAYR